MLIGICILSCGFSFTRGGQRFAIIIHAYNNADCIERCLSSALGQDFNNYYIVVIDDASTDHTAQIIKRHIEHSHKRRQITLVENTTRKFACQNFLQAIEQYTRDEDVVVLLEGNNALAEDQVLHTLDSAYRKGSPDVWLTFGQFSDKIDGDRGWCQPYSDAVVKAGAFRVVEESPFHLMTFKSWLARRIDHKDCMLKGKYFQTSYDLALMYPLIEMAGKHHKFINRITCVVENNTREQSDLDKIIRGQNRYAPLYHHPHQYCLRKDCGLCEENLYQNASAW